MVDRDSTDCTKEIAGAFTPHVYNQGPERSAQRNFGVASATGDYVAIIDSDMELTPEVIEQCVAAIQDDPGVAGVIIPELSFGDGFWSRCKALERSFYPGQDSIEAARFFARQTYIDLGGYDELLVSGEDWDFSQRVAAQGKLARISALIRHNEGRISLLKTMRKKHYYAKYAANYLAKNPQLPLTSPSGPIARYKLYFSRPAKLLKNPVVGLGMIFMKTAEYAAGGAGYASVILKRSNANAGRGRRYLLMSNNAHNLGDIAIAEATIQHIRSFDKTAAIILESNDPAVSRKYFPDIKIIPRYFGNAKIQLTSKILSFTFVRKNFRLVIKTAVKVVFLRIASTVRVRALMPGILREAADADYILSVCGDSMSERYGYFLRFIEINTLTKVNKNFVIYAQSIGPFSRPHAQASARRSLNKCRLILARDERTAALLREYGVTARVELTADSVISLRPNPTNEARQAIEQFAISQNTVGLVLRTPILSNLSGRQYKDYLEGTAYTVNYLQKRGFNVLMMGTIPEDCQAAAAFIGAHSLQNISILQLYNYKPSEVKHILAGLHSIISPRMHPIILSTSMLVPALALIQEFKLQYYMANIGLAGSTLPLTNTDRDLLTSKLNDLLERRNEYVQTIQDHIGVMTDLSLKNAAELRDLVIRPVDPAPDTKPLVSVIILNWNGKKWLERCLESLLHQTYSRLEVILVDNGSSDDSAAYVRSHFPRVKIVQSPDNRGFAGGNNLGISAAAGSLIMLLNNDTWLEPDAVRTLVNEKLRRGLGVIGAREAYYNDRENRDPYSTSIDPLGHPVNLFASGASKPSFYLSGVCLMFSKDLYLSTGGLDTNFFMYFEETDWFWRLGLLGVKFDYSEDIQVHHAGSGSTGNNRIKYKSFLWRNENTLQMLLKNYRWHSLLWILPLYLGQNVIEILFFLAILRPQIAFSYIEGWIFNARNLSGIMEKRAWVQHNRVIGDAQVLRQMYLSPAKLVHLKKVALNKRGVS
jgi:GT2 family glycosyltransferase/polysaccharide pyruvyl transferase WcaK-like protein